MYKSFNFFVFLPILVVVASMAFTFSFAPDISVFFANCIIHLHVPLLHIVTFAVTVISCQ